MKITVATIFLVLISVYGIGSCSNNDIDICEPFRLSKFRAVDAYQLRTVGECFRDYEEIYVSGYLFRDGDSSTSFLLYGSKEAAEKRFPQDIFVFVERDEIILPETDVNYVTFTAKYAGPFAIRYMGDLKVFELED